MLSRSILRTGMSSSPLAAETSPRSLQQRIKKVEISEPDHCLPSSFALVYFRRCRMWPFFNYVPKYVRQLLSNVIVLIFIMLAITRRRCYIGPLDLTSRYMQNILLRYSFLSLKSQSSETYSHTVEQVLRRH